MKYILTGLMALVVAGPAAATSLRITIQNDAAASGFAITPVYSAFHDGRFDAFNVGEEASDGLRTLAELGGFGTVRAEREAATTTAGVVTSTGAASPFITPDGPRPIFGGESVTTEVEITDVTAQRYFTFLSMIIPTNDLFIGNDNAIELFDSAGNFNGTQVLSITGANLYDAGTEVNNPNANPAFVAGVSGMNALIDPLDASLGSLADENGVVMDDAFGELERYNGLLTAGGFTLDAQQDLFGLASAFNIATITIEQIAAPVPLPAGSALLLSGLGVGAVMARRKKKKA
ncbi:MAG: spondin domain-containing protein [Aliishimia sp.]